MNDPRQRFRPLDVVVTIFVAFIIACLAIPYLQQERHRSRPVCVTNLKNLALSAIQYEASFGQFPGYLNLYGRWQGVSAGVLGDPADPDNHIKAAHWKIGSWHIALLPYLDAMPTYERWKEDKYPLLASDPTSKQHPDGYHFDSVPNLSVFQCSADRRKQIAGNNSYIANNGLFDLADPKQNASGLTFDVICQPANGIFNNKLPPYFASETRIPLALDAGQVSVGAAVTMADIRDGASVTLMFAESFNAKPYHHISLLAEERNQPASIALIEPQNFVEIARGKCVQGCVYTWEDDPQFSLAAKSQMRWSSRVADVVALARPSSSHGSGSYAGFCDGQVRFIEDTIDAVAYRQLLTPDDSHSSWGLR